MLYGRGPGFGVRGRPPMRHGYGRGPMGPPPMRYHRNNGCGCCLLPFLVVGAVIAAILILIF